MQRPRWLLLLALLGVTHPALADGPSAPPAPPAPPAPAARTWADDDPAALASPRPELAEVDVHARLVLLPVQLFEGTFALELEVAFGRHLSLGVATELVLFDSLFVEDWNSGLRSYGAVLTPRLYPLGRAPDGFFVGPEVRLSHLERSGAPLRGFGWDAGGVAGYAWTWERFTFVSAAGARYYERRLGEPGDELRSEGVAFSYRLGLGLTLR